MASGKQAMDPTAESQQDPSAGDDTGSKTHAVIISHAATTHTFTLSTSSTLADLRVLIQDVFSISPPYQKLTAPKLGLLKDDTIPITLLPPPPKRILLIGSSNAAIADAQLANSASASTLRKFGGTGPIKPARPTHRADWKKESDYARYTFGGIQVLRHLKGYERSEAYLHRLAADAGIKAVMAKHKFSVGMLSEMDPAEHTTHESRTLGLNKNAGEEILLRLRTDAYDGYRDYKTVRKTLCHELAHNVHSDHDRHFWDLYKVILKGVEEADWKHGGKTVEGYGDGRRVMWEGDEKEREWIEAADGGGWTGGSFVLGGDGNRSSTGVEIRSLSVEDRRSIAAKAAEERAKKTKDSGK
ncbi:hypothetical protein H072_3002 [Dactylellina haptotyla CBS 200.50]|uniref:WLM domain-containing protein n=1 Tax=Dactylellina haptotyla (strain CBS 200.50) TaxID=1284197 RepID=S8APH0_DACHA|nr:hypothetical protein H072_3002 [Dactylellina haptotyla CBS 200.50]